jgi:beta-galactosidase
MRKKSFYKTKTMQKIRQLLTLAVLSLGLLGPTATEARRTESLNTGWQFLRGPFSAEPQKAAARWNGPWQTVDLPHTWNATDMQKQYNNFYEGAAYYRRTLTLPATSKGKRQFLRFEGVGSCAEVYVNGRLAGTHRGAYPAFVVEITGAVDYGKPNEILVKADNTARPDVIPVNHVLFGVYGGIYRPVWLIETEQSNISLTDNASPGVFVTQKNVTSRGANVSVRVELDNGGLHRAAVVLRNTILTRDGKRIAADSKAISLTSQGTQSFTSNFHLTRPHLWQGRDDPYLYRVVATLEQDGRTIDEVVQPLGLRRCELVAGKGFFLNGKKYPLYGVCRHQDWWGLGSALKNENHDFDLSQIMEIGATTVRLAHYQQSDYFYSRCDSLGLLVWAEIPFVNQVTGQETENACQQLRELIRQSYNHPAIYVWGLHNEVYFPTAYTAQLTATLHLLAKSEDPYRYTVSTNGYGSMDHPVNLNADIQAMNRYFGWYEKKISDIDAWIEGLEKNYPDQLLMLSEYGADANIAHQTELLGQSLNWGRPYYPETFQTKVHEYQWSVIARHPYILGSYLWNMFDFATPLANRGGIPARNMKGMMTFDRKVRKDAFYWYKANWSKDPVLYLTQRRNTDRERRNTSITVYSNRGVPAVTLNGKALPAPRKGYTDVHWIIDHVTLADGKNTICTSVRDGNRLLTDTIVWNYSGEKDRSPGKWENRNVHAGL